MQILNEDMKLQLLNHAKQAMARAYTPYSKFNVGAALLTEDDTIIYGCNIENVAYGPSNCAERTALFSAIAQGHKPRTFKAIAVIGDTPDPITPCGVCRQVLLELLGNQAIIILGNNNGQWRETTVNALLPDGFLPDSLFKEDTH